MVHQCQGHYLIVLLLSLVSVTAFGLTPQSVKCHIRCFKERNGQVLRSGFLKKKAIDSIFAYTSSSSVRRSAECRSALCLQPSATISSAPVTDASHRLNTQRTSRQRHTYICFQKQRCRGSTQRHDGHHLAFPH